MPTTACGEGAYSIVIADRDAGNLKETEANLARLKTMVSHKIEFATKQVDATNRAAVRELLKGMDYLICMLPFDLVAGIAEDAASLGVHYFDVTEDVETSDAVRKIADQGSSISGTSGSSVSKTTRPLMNLRTGRSSNVISTC